MIRCRLNGANAVGGDGADGSVKADGDKPEKIHGGQAEIAPA